MSPDPIHTPPRDAAILRELDSVHADIKDEREQVHADMVANRAEVKETLSAFRAEVNLKLDAINNEVRLTNGRVRKLEVFVAVAKAFGVLFVALTPFIIYFLSQGG